MKFNYIVLILSIGYFSLSAQERYALVIGVQNYTSVPPLKNSLNDAKDMAEKLKRKGFKVIEVYNPSTKKDMQLPVRQYYALISEKTGAEGIIYYAGHAVQVDGSNFLMPANANPEIKADLQDQCVEMNYVLRALEEAGNALNIIIMDACRNNPFRSFSRGVENGLNQVLAPKGSYVVYATSPGNVASDGEGRNGLFTSKLLKYMDEPGLNFEQMFKRVASEVDIASEHRQTPWISSSYTGDFYFNENQNESAKPAAINPSDSKLAVQPRKENKEETYASIKIGKSIWMTQNLETTAYRNGDEIPEVSDADEWSKLTTGAWCFYPEKSGVDQPGTNSRLYNWYAATDPRGICPAGWHLPDEADWVALESAGGTENGNGIKSLEGWFNNKNGNNTTGFNGKPAGIRSSTGAFSLKGMSAYWWSSVGATSNSVKVRLASFSRTTIGTAVLPKGSGLSIRCIKD